MQVAKMKYLANIIRSIDQFFNALIGGNPDCTISGHVGLMAERAIFSDNRWRKLEKLIDFTFAPIEKNHCENSFLIDDDIDTTENFHLTAIITVIGCSILYIPIRIMALWH